MKNITIVAILLATLPALLAAQSPQAETHPAAEIRIELDQTLLPADTPAKSVVKIAVTPPAVSRPQHRPPVNLAIVLDRSGSMSGQKIEHARRAAIEALRRLRPGDLFSLVTFDSEIETVIPAQHVRDLTHAESQILAIQPRGSTALYGGVNQAASEIRKHLEPAYVHRILLLSDGIANAGPSSPSELENLGRALARENIAVSTVGIGLDYHEDLLTRLARASDGNTYFVEAAQDLPRILGAELGDVLNVFARNAVIRIEFPPNIRPASILGRDGKIDGQTVEIPLHQLYGEQERFALVEIEIPARADGTQTDLGRAELRYEDVSLQQSVSTRSPAATVSHSANPDAVSASADFEIKKQILETRAAEARHRAIALADQGNRAAAARELREIQSNYATAARAFNDPDLARQSNALASEAETVERAGIDNRTRKYYRASNHQTINQQNAK